MRRFTLIIALLSVAISANAQYDAMFDASRVQGMIGDTVVKLYLAPSPHIRDAAVNFISSATGTLDVCVYEINLPQVLDVLIDADAKGVKVRLAVPPKARPSKYDDRIIGKFEQLEKRKAIRYTEPKSGLMHTKFMVSDGAAIWTGSYNLTKNDTEMNDNNAIVLTNRLLAANYTAEFEEIWADKHGKKNATPTPNPTVKIGDVIVQNYFSPEDDVDGAVIREIGKATNSIYVMAFALTDDGIFTALTNRMAAGVKVWTLFDLELARQKTSLSEPLKAAKAGVRISSNNGQMHHKVMVIDERVVITGSANFSASAYNNNDENTLIFACPPLARAFMRECERCWLAKPYIYSKWSQQVRSAGTTICAMLYS